MKDIAKEKTEKEQSKKVEEEKVSWFQKVPSLYKLAGIGIIFVKYLSITNKGGDITKIWMWVLVVVLIWYFIGSEGKRREGDVLTPREAIEAVEKEVEWLRKSGKMNRWSQVYVGPHTGLFHHEGMPQHYQVSVELVDDKGGRQHKRAIVNAEGPTIGYATIQEAPGRVTGREPIPVISPLPNWLKRSQKYDLDLDKYIFGDKK